MLPPVGYASFAIRLVLVRQRLNTGFNTTGHLYVALKECFLGNMSSAVADLEAGLNAMQALKPPGVSGSKIQSLTALCVENVQVSIGRIVIIGYSSFIVVVTRANIYLFPPAL